MYTFFYFMFKKSDENCSKLFIYTFFILVLKNSDKFLDILYICWQYGKGMLFSDV